MKQLEWVNVAKGIAIIAVVLSHTNHGLLDYNLFPLKSIVYGIWFVPLFFVLGGFFIKEEKLCNPKGFIKGKMKSLYSLLLYFYIPAVLLHNVFLDIGFYDTVTQYGGKTMVYWEPLTFAKELLLSCCFMGREPILGAMWFVYVLLLALIGFSIISFILRKYVDNDKYEYVRGILLLAICVISCSATNLCGITIPRCNNTLTAIWLIYCGYILNQHVKVRYDNKWIVVLSCIIIYHIACIQGGVSLNTNSYADVLTLTVSTIASLYVICYISRKIEKNILGRILAYCGKESFYIMALHFVGFKLLTLILNELDFNLNLSSLIAPSNGNIFFAILYVVMGVSFPLLFMFIFRLLKSKLHK